MDYSWTFLHELNGNSHLVLEILDVIDPAKRRQPSCDEARADAFLLVRIEMSAQLFHEVLGKGRDRLLDSHGIELDCVIVAAAGEKGPLRTNPLPQQNVKGENGAAELLQEDVREGGE